MSSNSPSERVKRLRQKIADRAEVGGLKFVTLNLATPDVVAHAQANGIEVEDFTCELCGGACLGTPSSPPDAIVLCEDCCDLLANAGAWDVNVRRIDAGLVDRDLENHQN